MQVKEIDMRGQICPSSLLMALREINANKLALRSGVIRLSFLSDNRDSTATIPESAANMGYEVSVIKEADSYRIDVFAKPDGMEKRTA
ncbi:MAG: tRNA methyltransferase [Desulfuromonadales bacterium GWD2_54_10]|nr:MAG: tRNA methyltransferase [Desulfuromonadales bacterium GWD2_54_10]